MYILNHDVYTLIAVCDCEGGVRYNHGNPYPCPHCAEGREMSAVWNVSLYNAYLIAWTADHPKTRAPMTDFEYDEYAIFAAVEYDDMFFNMYGHQAIQ